MLLCARLIDSGQFVVASAVCASRIVALAPVGLKGLPVSLDKPLLTEGDVAAGQKRSLSGENRSNTRAAVATILGRPPSQAHTERPPGRA